MQAEMRARRGKEKAQRERPPKSECIERLCSSTDYSEHFHSVLSLTLFPTQASTTWLVCLRNQNAFRLLCRISLSYSVSLTLSPRNSLFHTVLKCTSGVTWLGETTWAPSWVAAGSPACWTLAVPVLQNATSSTSARSSSCLRGGSGTESKLSQSAPIISARHSADGQVNWVWLQRPSWRRKVSSTFHTNSSAKTAGLKRKRTQWGNKPGILEKIAASGSQKQHPPSNSTP